MTAVARPGAKLDQVKTNGQMASVATRKTPIASRACDPLCGSAYKAWLKEEKLEDATDLFAEEPVVGLQNLGNMCFLNAVLQCLYYTPLLRRTLYRMIASSPEEAPEEWKALDEWISALLQIFRDLD